MTSGGYTQPEAWNLQLQSRIARFEAALRRLTIAARTSGGVAGPDAELMAACELAEAELARAAIQPETPDHG